MRTKKSAYDGFFLLDFIKPGKYTVRISAADLESKNVTSSETHDVEVTGSCTVLSGLDFTLTPGPDKNNSHNSGTIGNPGLHAPKGINGMNKLIDIMARLRDPRSGCPWDVEQTFATIAPYTIEEAYEVADAIDRDDMPGLRDELGDLLLQVVFHARMAEEAGLFAFDQVVDAICDKMIRRHPHVFGDDTVDSAEAQTANWENLKAAEREQAGGDGRPASVLDGVAGALPALMRAEKLQKRASRVGFDWDDPARVLDKLTEEISEVREAIAMPESPARANALEDEIGDLLFVVTNLARHLAIDPEQALRRGNGKFERRFRAMERHYADAGVDIAEIPLDDLESQWQAVKRRLDGGPENR
ncbi:MAG: nucleoside triphosphate pyrophosphohydrolase [Rhodospirillaceae bacterium]